MSNGAMTRNGENRWVSPILPTSRGYAKLGDFPAEVKSRFRSLVDFCDISEVKAQLVGNIEVESERMLCEMRFAERNTRIRDISRSLSTCLAKK